MNNYEQIAKARGCLVGLACGDYLGMPYEFGLPQKIREYFSSHKLQPVRSSIGTRVFPPGFYTDDTSLAICLAESLIEKGFDTKDQFRRFKKWFYEGYATPTGDKAFGVGMRTLQSLTKQTEDILPTKLTDNPKAGGNGALMRCAPIGIRYFQSTDQLIKFSLLSAIVTHNNTIAAWSCIVLNSFISYSLKGIDKKDFRNLMLNNIKELPKELKDLLKADFNRIKEDQLQTSGYSLHTLAIALFSFFNTDNFEDCVTKAVSMGGDADTQGAVAGALGGAYYGEEAIPSLWRATLMRHKHIRSLAEKLYEQTK